MSVVIFIVTVLPPSIDGTRWLATPIEAELKAVVATPMGQSGFRHHPCSVSPEPESDRPYPAIGSAPVAAFEGERVRA
jgi:hypothetical protein